MNIRFATIQDMNEVLNIYTYYVKHSTATFAYQVPTLAEFETQFLTIAKEYPFLVGVEDDRIIAYAYAHKHKEKEAYQWNVELTIYVDINNQKQQVGSALLETLLDLLKRQQVRNVYSCITVPNEASMALHYKFGFDKIAYFPSTGFKHGVWLDVVWLQKVLWKDAQPRSIITIADIKNKNRL